jgi:hypothetical protein
MFGVFCLTGARSSLSGPELGVSFVCTSIIGALVAGELEGPDRRVQGKKGIA